MNYSTIISLKEITEAFLGKPNMSDYPLALNVGLLILSLYIKYWHNKSDMPEFDF
jgi:hypothetical protein